MRTREKVELFLIVAVAAIAWALSGRLPRSMPVGILILTASVLLLGQGLLRDLWVKYGAGQDHPAASLAAPSAEPAASAGVVGGSPEKPQKIVCMCMESTLGVVGVIGGLSILLCGIGRYIAMEPLFWPMLVLSVGATGFYIKDFVLDWKARSLRRVKDHRSVIPW